MKKREFNLELIGPDYNGGFQKVYCTDYDEECGLVRFKDTIYDIRTGLWVIRQHMIKEGSVNWAKAGCTKVENITLNEMLFYVKNNIKFMAMVERCRMNAKNKGVVTMNEEEYNLFTL